MMILKVIAKAGADQSAAAPNCPRDALSRYRECQGFNYFGGTMKIIGRVALAAVAVAGLVFGASAPAAADVIPHKHCLYIETVDGYVLIAEGVSLKAPNDPALESVHYRVHLGEPTQDDRLKITRLLDLTAECPNQLPLAPAE